MHGLYRFAMTRNYTKTDRSQRMYVNITNRQIDLKNTEY
jgi:hypothetical protein